MRWMLLLFNFYSFTQICCRNAVIVLWFCDYSELLFSVVFSFDFAVVLVISSFCDIIKFMFPASTLWLF